MVDGVGHMEIGRLFMFGFEGTKPTRDILDLIRRGGLGGIILFSENIESASQLRSITAELRDASPFELLIGIDEEGGRVKRLPRAMIDIPPMGELGKDGLNEDAKRCAYDLGRELGRVLTEVGINLNFAPVLDVLTNRKNTVIGDRALSGDPEVVATLGCELIKGMSREGVISCAKHFPGHGDTEEDSHVVLPRLRHDLDRLRGVELVPFMRAIQMGVPALMSAHVLYEGVDNKNPATLSKRILTQILRDELGFGGLLFSDDLEMKAISNLYDIGEASVRAIDAGCDMLLVCHNESSQRKAMDAVRVAVDLGVISSERIDEALGRARRTV